MVPWQGVWWTRLEWLALWQDAVRIPLPALTRVSCLLGPGVGGGWLWQPFSPPSWNMNRQQLQQQLLNLQSRSSAMKDGFP